MRKRERAREYPSDKMWGIDKALGAPKRVIEISPMSFQLCRKATVNDNVATALSDEIRHKSRRRCCRRRRRRLHHVSWTHVRDHSVVFVFFRGCLCNFKCKTWKCVRKIETEAQFYRVLESRN